MVVVAVDSGCKNEGTILFQCYCKLIVSFDYEFISNIPYDVIVDTN
jgi:hypothetical protein